MDGSRATPGAVVDAPRGLLGAAGIAFGRTTRATASRGEGCEHRTPHRTPRHGTARTRNTAPHRTARTRNTAPLHTAAQPNPPTRRPTCPPPSATPPHRPQVRHRPHRRGVRPTRRGLRHRAGDHLRGAVLGTRTPRPGLGVDAGVTDRGRGQPHRQGAGGLRGVGRQSVPLLRGRAHDAAARHWGPRARGGPGTRRDSRRRAARARAGLGRGDPDTGRPGADASPLPPRTCPRLCRYRAVLPLHQPDRVGAADREPAARQRPAVPSGPEPGRPLGRQDRAPSRRPRHEPGAPRRPGTRSGLGTGKHRRPGLRRTAHRHRRGRGPPRRGRPDPRTGNAPSLERRAPAARVGRTARPLRPGARLALLVALAPYRITDEDITAWRKPEHSDHCLVHLVAYGAFAAVDRIESALPFANYEATPPSRTVREQ